MKQDVLASLATRLPELFAAAVAALEQRAAQGDTDASSKLGALSDEPVGARLHVLETPAGQLAASVERRRLRITEPGELPAFGHAVALSERVWTHGLSLFEQKPTALEDLARVLCLMGSRTARELFGEVTYAFDLTVERVPVVGQVRARVMLGRPALSPKSEFALTVDYDELEDAREQGLGPHQLFLAGKVRIDGDVAKAMMLGMTLAQLD